MKKNNKILVVVIVILSVLVILLGGYIGYDKIFNKEKDTSFEDSKKEIVDNKSEEKTDSYKDLSIDNSKCLTDCSDIKYEVVASIAGDGVYASIINDEKTEVAVSINRELLKEKYLYEFGTDDSVYHFQFPKKVQDIFIGHIGQDASMPMLFVLMEDGSVTYVDLYSKITTGEAKQIKLVGVSNIIKFYTVSARSKNQEVTGQIITVLAQKEDGSFYDLEKIIFNGGR